MIERHVYIKLDDAHANDAGRAELAERSRKLAEIPGVVEVKVGLPADADSLAAWDLAITLCFERLDAVEPYRVHPLHVEFLENYLKSRTVVRKVWNFEV